MHTKTSIVLKKYPTKQTQNQPNKRTLKKPKTNKKGHKI